MNFASKIFFVLGISFILFGLILTYQRFSPTRLAFAGQVSSNATIDKQYAPSVISIPKLSIELPIYASDVVDGRWESSSTGVNYLVTSPLPGTTGNSVLYGHNWQNILGKLVQIKAQDIIFISYPNAQIKEFRVIYTSIVQPDDIGVLGTTSDKRITLYTCTGFLDSKRFVVTAILNE